MQKIINRIIIGTIFVLVITTSFSCKRAAGISDKYYVQKDVHPSELIGEWGVSDLTVEKLSQEGFRKYVNGEHHSLLLSEDGSCSISTFTYLTTSLLKNEELNYINNGKGRWQIGRSAAYIFHQLQYVPSLDIQIVNIDSILMKDTTSISFYIAEDKKGIFLWRHISDPDYGNYYILRKNLYKLN